MARFSMWITRCKEKDRQVKNGAQLSGLGNCVNGNKSCNIDDESKR